MANLYELTGAFLELLEMACDENIDQQMIIDTLEGVEFEFEQKAVGYARVIKQLEGDAETLDKEIKRLQARKKTMETNIKNIKENLENAMRTTGKVKFKTLEFSFGIQKNPPSAVIDDDTKIPEEYLIKQAPKIDTKAIKEFLKENTADWAHLEQSESLRIR